MKHKPSQRQIDISFLHAVRENNIAAARQALQDGANIDVTTPPAHNALLIAVDKNNYGMADFLLKSGINQKVLHSGHGDAPPLRVATINKNLQMVELLLSHGADPNWPPREDVYDEEKDISRGNRGFLALHQAASDDSLEIAKLLIAHNADLHMQTRQMGRPLYFGVVRKNPDIVATLLVNGAEPNGDQGMYPTKGEVVYHQQSVLFNLTDARSIPILRMCLDAGADTERRNEKGQNIEEAMKYMDGRELVLEVYEHYRNMPKMTDEVLSSLTKEQLFAPNAHGLCLMDSPSTWRRFGEVETQLAKRGEALSVGDWESTNHEGTSWLERGAQCFALSEVMSSYIRAGGTVMEAFLDKDNHRRPLLKTALRLQQEEHVMDISNWVDSKATPDDLQMFYRALRPEQRQLVTNYHGLKAVLEQQQPQEMTR